MTVQRKFSEEVEYSIFQNLTSVINSGYLSSRYGKMTRRFEKAFAEKMGAKYAVAVNSGTSALHVALLASGVEPGYMVLVPPIGPIMTAASVLKVGAIPVFVDIDPETYCMDLNSLIVSHPFFYFMPVHIFGNKCKMSKLAFSIEDCAQSFSPLRGNIACYSFEQSKHTCCGDGGMIVTNNKDRADRMRLYSDVALSTEINGYNYRMNELTAAVGLAQLKHAKGGKLYETKYVPDGADEYEKELKANGVEYARAPWGRLVYQHKLFGEQQGLCPIAERIHPNLFVFPVKHA